MSTNSNPICHCGERLSNHGTLTDHGFVENPEFDPPEPKKRIIPQNLDEVEEEKISRLP